MVTKLTQFKTDPNGLGRGAGLYYLRGGVSSPYKISRDGKRVKPKGYTSGRYYSKYCPERDENKLSDGWRTHKIGTPKKTADKYAHVSDGDLTRKRW